MRMNYTQKLTWYRNEKGYTATLVQHVIHAGKV